MASLCAPPFPLAPQIFYSLFASLSCFSSGMCTGWASQTLLNTETRSWSWGVYPQEVPWILATLELGALMSCLPAGYAIDKYGRKYVLITTGFLYLLSWLIVLAADMRPGNLYSARVVAGLAMGASAIAVPTYVAEVAEARVRGLLLTLSKAMTLAGLVTMHVMGPSISYRTLVAVGAVPTVLFLVTFSWSPESPHLLAMKERWNKATETLHSLRGSAHCVKLELNELMRKDQERIKVPWQQLLRAPVPRTSLLTAAVFTLLANMSGYSALAFYAVLNLPMSSDPSFIAPETFVVAFSAVMLAGCLLSALFIDLLGRRLVFMSSAVLCTVSMAATGVSFQWLSECEELRDSCGIGWWLVGGLLAWAFSYGWGLISMPGILAAELAPTNARGITNATVTGIGALCSFLATKTFEIVTNLELGAQVACWVYAAFSAFCFLAALLILPETKGKALATVQRELTERLGGDALLEAGGAAGAGAETASRPQPQQARLNGVEMLPIRGTPREKRPRSQGHEVT